MRSLTLLTPPAAEPVSLASAKVHLRIDHSADDALITDLITAARQMAEAFTGRAFITQTWKLVMDEAPSAGFIALPRPPLASVTHVKTYDEADTATTMNASNYFVDTVSQPGRVILRSSGVWPTVSRSANGFEVQYVAGYGSQASDVPLALRQGILSHIAHLYENRGEGLSPQGDVMQSFAPASALSLYLPYRVLRGLA